MFFVILGGTPILGVVTLPNGGFDTLATLSAGGGWELNVVSEGPGGGQQEGEGRRIPHAC